MSGRLVRSPVVTLDQPRSPLAGLPVHQLAGARPKCSTDRSQLGLGVSSPPSDAQTGRGGTVGSNSFEQSIEEPKKHFESILLADLSDERVVNSKILHGGCYALSEDQHFSLKEAIANHFSISPHQEVFIVGSAKLGFSVAPHKRYRLFGDASDIDVAIVSHNLYEKVWHEAHAYADSGAGWPRQGKFEQYISWGWIRPDMLPRSPSFQFSEEWRQFFRELQRGRQFGPYKIAGALYHDMHFLTQYQRRAVRSCREAMEAS